MKKKISALFTRINSFRVFERNVFEELSLQYFVKMINLFKSSKYGSNIVNKKHYNGGVL
ncbi:hypothetical protein SAMN02745945_01880 [Peptoclostridium litorale DSM 5388]|uniref:Uncharacterized protein n=1 Tax=Peptoclostridium litorale DSM 5388 TaxID=1121324 RepID=A0A069RNT8_PEPLI|nr:hypothetical protein CLIT_8c00160 [Peptoclostridium litorale DSM 5388]SIO11443.1 hypothetical protein SAMN02745945_01880 [Peptoclostridium litorale DSM 5388]